MAVIRFFNTVEPVISVFRLWGAGLRAEGHEVEIVTTTFKYRQNGQSLSQWAREHGVRIVSPPGVGDYPRTRAGKALVAAYYVLFSTIYALLGRQSTVNVFFTQPPLFHVMGSLLRWLRGQHYLCVVMDLYPEILTATGTLSKTGLVAQAMSRISTHGFRNAARVISIGRCMSERLIAKGVNEDKLILIRNWPEAWILEYAHENHLQRPELERLGIDGKFVCLYSGNIGIAHSTGELAEAIQTLRADSGVHFLFISDGARANALRESLDKSGADNATWLPYQPQETVARIMKEVDMHLVTQRDGFEGIVVPSKAYSALAAGRPIMYIGNPLGEIARMVEEEKIGWVIPPGNSALIVETCRYLATHRETWQQSVNRIPPLTRTRHSAKDAQAKYVSVIKNTIRAD